MSKVVGIKKRGSAHRASTRFNPEASDVARIGHFEENGEFFSDFTCLIIDESYTGCGLVVLHADDISVGDLRFIQIGDEEPVRAEVVWKTHVEEEIFRIGFNFPESE